MRNRAYTNGVLSVIALLLLVVAMDARGGSGALAPASAAAQTTQPGDPTGLISAAEQRKQIIEELRNMNKKLDKLDAALAKGVNVKVTDMPESKAQGEKPGAK